MARPIKNGLDYFPMDVHACDQFKVELVEAKYGMEGFALLIKLYMKIYSQWYFMQYSEDYGMILSRRFGVSYERFKEMLDFFIQKDLFDRKLFEEKQILTSRGIQERWLRGCEKRAKINIKKESWLIDASTVFEGEKLSKICIIGEAGVSSGSLPVETPQSKVEEIRLEERRERVEQEAPAPAHAPARGDSVIQEPNPVELKPNGEKKEFTPPTMEGIKEYIQTLGYNPAKANEDAERIFNYYDAVGWVVGRSPVIKWRPLVRKWMSNDFQRSHKSNLSTPGYLEIGKHEEASPGPDQQIRKMIEDAKAGIDEMNRQIQFWEQAATERNVPVEELLDPCSLRKYNSLKKELPDRIADLRDMQSTLDALIS